MRKQGTQRRQPYRKVNRRENSPPDCFLILLIGRHPLRQVPKGLPLGHRLGRNRHVLAMTQERVLTLGKK